MAEGIVMYGMSGGSTKGGTTPVAKAPETPRTIKLSASTVKNWEKMTDWNEHGKVRESIAKRFAKEDDRFKELAKEFADINKEHMRIGHLAPELGERRRAAELKMLGMIKQSYGDGVLNKVRGSL